MYNDPFDYLRCNYNFLPKKNLGKWIYNEVVEKKLAKAKKMETLLPKGSDPIEMNYLLLQIVSEAYQLKGYLDDA